MRKYRVCASIGSYVFLDISSDIRLTGKTDIFLETRMSVAAASGLLWPVFLAEKKSFGMKGVPKNQFAGQIPFFKLQKYLYTM